MSDTAFAPNMDSLPEKLPPSEPQQAQDIMQRNAQRTARSTLRGEKTPDTALPKITTEEEYEQVKPGQFYLDPSGTKLQRFHEVHGEDDYADVPEGSKYVDPEGNVQTKPVPEGVGYTAQTLFDMAANDKERFNALNRSYPGKVQRVGREWYVEDEDGTLRAPRGMTQTASGLAGGLSAAAAPTVGAIGGEIGGGLVGNVPGAIGGAMGGAVLGQSFNDAILAATGVYDRSLGEQAGETAISGVTAGLGTGVGRAIGSSSAVRQIPNAGRTALADFLGADKKALESIIKMKEEKGLGLVGPSVWAKEAPHLQQITETLDPALRTQKPLEQSSKKYYEEQAGGILQSAGVQPETKLLEPEAKVSSRLAGQQLLDKASAEVVASDAKVAEEFAKRKVGLEATAAAAPDKGGLETAAKESRGVATKLIEATFQDMERDVNTALKQVKAGHNSGDLWQTVADKLRAIHTAIIGRSQKFYSDAYKVAGDFKYGTADLSDDAKAFLDNVPEEFQKAYPSVIAKLRDLAGKPALNKEGVADGWIKEPVTELSLQEAHGIRTIMRSAADWYNIPSDFRNGSLKHFANQLDGLIQQVPTGSEAETAVRMLNATDEWYGGEIKVFNARNIKAVVDGLKAGEPADPEVLRDVIVKPGHSDMTRKIMEMIGPNLASAVRAADTKAMMNQSLDLNGNIEMTRFASEVSSRYKDGTLHTLHGKEGGDRLLRQAQIIQGLEGKLPIQAKPGDTAADIVMRAKAAQEAAEKAAKIDPMRILSVGVKKLEAEQKKAVSATREKVSDGPLNFLYNADYGAVKAADHILGSEDLLFAAANKFGRASPEFQALQKVWLERMLVGDMDVSAKLLKYTPEAQSLMLPPGVSQAQVQTLAKEMNLLLSQRGIGGTGASIMAQHAVAHPAGYLPETGHSKTIKWVASTAVGRAALTKYTSWMLNVMNNPWLMRQVMKGLEGDTATRAATRAQIKRWSQIGGAVGAGTAEGQYQTPNQQVAE